MGEFGGSEAEFPAPTQTAVKSGGCKMLLAIDVGNTNITLGVYPTEAKKPSIIWRLVTDTRLTADEYGCKILELFHSANLSVVDVRAVAIASVVPGINVALKEMSLSYLKNKAFFVGKSPRPALKVLGNSPGELGADRIANAVAAFERFGGPCIIIDFGTATTFDCVTKKGEYAGGAICPGPNVAVASLVKHTAQLPMIQMARPKKYIGRSTVECMQSGLYFGYVGLIKELLSGIKRELGGPPKIIATGGLARIVLNELKEVIDVIPELTLDGIRLIWKKSKS
jgi:type III pantothenate kinase